MALAWGSISSVLEIRRHLALGDLYAARNLYINRGRLVPWLSLLTPDELDQLDDLVATLPDRSPPRSIPAHFAETAPLAAQGGPGAPEGPSQVFSIVPRLSPPKLAPQMSLFEEAA